MAKNDIDIAEGYQRTHKAFEHINFSGYDYDTIKQSLISYLQLNYPESFNDYIESSEVMTIIEAFAYVGELMAYRIDANVHENFISQATRKDSILRLARLIGYVSKRRTSSRGLVRIESISTSESIRDSRGTELRNRVIQWNDSSNVNWQEQFFSVMGLILVQNFGEPIRSVLVDSIGYELYASRITGLSNGVFPYSVATSQKNIRMELVSGALSSTGTSEEVPSQDDEFRLFYRNDNLGLGSRGTGFMMQTVQGELVRSVYDFDQPIPNRKIILPHLGINNTDVYVISRESIDTTAQITQWNRVDSLRGENLYFNPEEERKNYEAVTLDNDGVEIHFGDAAFATIPIGPFNIWSRISEPEPIVIPRSKFKAKEFSFTYYDKEANAQTATVRFTLINTLNNATPSEDIERIRNIAPSMYYTQDRMVNSRDYNEFLFQDPSVLKLKAVNRTFSGASKYQKFQDASGNYQNIQLFGDDLRLYIDDGYVSRVYSRGEGATELQLIDTILETVLQKKEVQEHLTKIQGVITPRPKFRESLATIMTYTGSTINTTLDRPYPERGHDQEKTELQGRIDGKYYGALGDSPLTYPVDGLSHVNQNVNVYLLKFDIPGEAAWNGVFLNEFVQGTIIEGLSTGAKGFIQSIYPVETPDPVYASYAGYDAIYRFNSNEIDTSFGVLYINDDVVSTGFTILTASTISASATTVTSIADIELRIPSLPATHINSTDTWSFFGATVADATVYVDNSIFTLYNTIANGIIDVSNSNASALQTVDLRYAIETATDQGSSGDITWINAWQFVGTPKPVLEGDIFINGVPAVIGVDYILPNPLPAYIDTIWTQTIAPQTIELKFDDVTATHTNHIADWNVPNTQIGINSSNATLTLNGSILNPINYDIINASNFQIDASATNIINVDFSPNIGTYVSGIDRWEFSGVEFAVGVEFASLWLNAEYVDPSVNPYTLVQINNSTASITMEANTINTEQLSLHWNEAAIAVIEASSTSAVLSFDDYETLRVSALTGNLHVNGGIGAKLLSQSNTLFTYQIQDGSGGGIGNKSIGLHTAGVNSGASSNDAFGIGYDRVLDQYYTIAPENLGDYDSKFSREFARDVAGTSRDDSWVVRVKPIRSGGETQYLVGNRTVELAVHGLTKDFFYQNDRALQNDTTGLVVEDTFAILGINTDIRDERTIGENILFPVVRQPINEITGKQERRTIIIKEFDTNQDGIPDDRNSFARVVDAFSADLVLGLDGRHNNLPEGEYQIARDIASIYGPTPHKFDFEATFIKWQERYDYYGDGAWEIPGPYNLSFPTTNGGSTPTYDGGSTVIGGGVKYNMPVGVDLVGGYWLYLDGIEVPEYLYAIDATVVHVAFEQVLGYTTPTGSESLELRPKGIVTQLDDILQIASTFNVPELTDFTIETIIRLDNLSGITLYDGFHKGGYSTGGTTIQTLDGGWRLDIKSSVEGQPANMIELTVGSGVLIDASTYSTVSTSISHTLETDPQKLRRLPHYSNFDDKQFHHIAVSRSTSFEYHAIDLNDYVLDIKNGDKITDVNGSTALIWDFGKFDLDVSNGLGRIWIYDIKYAVGFSEFGSTNEPFIVNRLRLDGTFGELVTDGLVMNEQSYRTLKFFVDGVGSDVINLSTDYADTIDFAPVDSLLFPNISILGNSKTRNVGDIPAGETAVAYCDGVSISRNAKFGEDFNDINNVYKKYPRIFPQTVFFHRPDTLSDYTAVTTIPTPLVINDDIESNSPDKRLYKEFIGRDDVKYLWTHFTPRANLIDPSKTNIIDMFVHSYGYQRELEEWLSRNDITEPQPQPPSSLDLKTAYGKYLSKGMLSDTIIMHPGRIKYLFGLQATATLRAKFRAVKRDDSKTSDEQLKTFILDIINDYFDINRWDFGRPFYFTDLSSAIHTALPNDIQSIVLVPSAGVSRFGDLFQITPEDDEILQSATKVSDIEIIAGITRQNIRRSDD